jgi:hypothetical protein
MRRAGIIVIDLDTVPLHGDMLVGKLQQQLPEVWTHPGVAAEVGTV